MLSYNKWLLGNFFSSEQLMNMRSFVQDISCHKTWCNDDKQRGGG
jgi:hypothetical protein